MRAVLVWFLIAVCLSAGGAVQGQSRLPVTVAEMLRLEKGEILLTGSIDASQSGMVEGRILIPASPERVWSVVVNPNEFANKIQKHLRTVRVVRENPKTSVLDCQVEVISFLPRINYVVESFYEPCRKIDFRRVGGSLRDFRGQWLLEPADNGRKTLVTYAMYIDPGFFVPQWIMRAGLRRELPQTLSGIKDRVNQLEMQTAAAPVHSHS